MTLVACRKESITLSQKAFRKSSPTQLIKQLLSINGYVHSQQKHIVV